MGGKCNSIVVEEDVKSCEEGLRSDEDDVWLREKGIVWVCEWGREVSISICIYMLGKDRHMTCHEDLERKMRVL